MSNGSVLVAAEEEEASEATGFGQPTRLIICANHGNNVISPLTVYNVVGN